MVDQRNANEGMNRRQLLQAAAVAGVMLSCPVVGCCSSLPSYVPLSPDDGKALVLTHANIIDVLSGRVLSDRFLVIRGGIIESISDRMPTPQEGQLVYDLKHRYVIPGLIDAHCHTTLTGEGGLKILGLLTTYCQVKRNYQQQLIHGVTTVRDMGAMPKLLASMLKKIDSSEMIGPRVVFCNAFTNIHGGHPDIDQKEVSSFSDLAVLFIGDPNLWFNDIDALKKGMKQNLAAGASFIKLTMDDKSIMCARGAIPAYSDEQLRVIMEFAGQNNVPTAGHIHTRFGFDRAIQYGLSSVEHMIGDGPLTDREVDQMAKKKISLVPTMIIAQMLAAEEAYSELPAAYSTDFIAGEMAIRKKYLQSCTALDVEPGIHRDNMASLNHLRKDGCEVLSKQGVFLPRPELYFNILLHGPGNLLKMKQAGILIGCGTDSGVPFMYHGALWREMEMLGRIGFTNQEILQCATINNARILRMADKIGSIEPGKYADMAVLADNPLDRIEACKMPALVVKGGRIYAPATGA